MSEISILLMLSFVLLLKLLLVLLMLLLLLLLLFLLLTLLLLLLLFLLLTLLLLLLLFLLLVFLFFCSSTSPWSCCLHVELEVLITSPALSPQVATTFPPHFATEPTVASMFFCCIQQCCATSTTPRSNIFMIPLS